jgi:DNA polymerase-3 subunit alpha
MSIVRELAGYSLGGADILRRAMGKKNASIMQKQRDIFINGSEDGKIPGAIKNGIPIAIANKLFEQMEKFSEYAFNKCHAAPYAVLAYQTGYLKRYYPVHYIAAVINNRITNIDEVTKYILILKSKGIKIFPADINKSGVYFKVEGGGVRFGLMGIKGVGEGAITSILAERDKGGDFNDLYDFISRVDSVLLNKRLLENMIFAGAFDCFGKSRATMIGCYDIILEQLTSEKKQQATGQMSFFEELAEEESGGYAYHDIEEFPAREKLKKEKEVLGMYVSGHPLADYSKTYMDMPFNLALLRRADADRDEEDAGLYNLEYDGKPVEALGLISSISKKQTRTGKMMAYGTLEDLYDNVELILFPNVYDKYKGIIEDGALLKINGMAQVSDADCKIVVNGISAYSSGMSGVGDRASGIEGEAENIHKQKILCIRLDGKEHCYDDIVNMLATYRGDIPVRIQINNELKQVNVGADDSGLLLWELKATLGKDNVKIIHK